MDNGTITIRMPSQSSGVSEGDKMPPVRCFLMSNLQEEDAGDPDYLYDPEGIRVLISLYYFFSG